MVQKVNILQLVPRFPFPMDDGGKIGIANIYKEFSRQADSVDLFSLNHEDLPESAIKEAEEFGNVTIVEHDTRNSKGKILKNLFSSNSLYVSKHYSEKAIKELDYLIDNNNFTIVHTDHSCMAPLAFYAAKKIGCPVGLRQHNIEWMIWQRYADEIPSHKPQKYYIQMQASRLKKEEEKIFTNMDACFAITENEKKLALEMSANANVIVASAGVDLDDWQVDDSLERNPHEMILATTYHWIHNVNAVRWFVDNVLPLVRKEIPDAYIRLIGKNAPEWLNDYKDKGVIVEGYVPSVQEYLNKASVYVAPLFVGAGIRIKILEAMAMELPVIATDISADGIIPEKDNGLIIANSAEEYAKAIIQVTQNTNLRNKLSKNARKFIENNYSWKVNVGKMLAEYRRLLGN